MLMREILGKIWVQLSGESRERVALAIYQKECYSVDKGIEQEEFLEMEREVI